MQTEFYPNGRLKAREYTVIFKGISVPLLRETWYESGQKRTKSNYKNGIWHGLQEGWYECSCTEIIHEQQKYRWNYYNDVKHGLQEYWHLNGKLQSKGNYISVASPEGTHGYPHGIQIYENDIVYDKYGNQIAFDQYGNRISIEEYITTYYKYGKEITKEEYEKYLNSVEKGILNILCIGKNTLDLIIKRYLI